MEVITLTSLEKLKRTLCDCADVFIDFFEAMIDMLIEFIADEET